MRDIDLFQMALGLAPPWTVVSCEFDLAKKRLDLGIDYPRGSLFTCPECGKGECKAHDSTQKTWRHLNFFQYEAYLSARVPRTKCDKCGIKLVKVPWAREGSGFTLLFEAMVLMMVKSMPVKTISRMLGEHDTRLWRILDHYVHKTRENTDLSGVRRVGADETASRRGHKYVSVFVDMDNRRVLFATEGKDAGTVAAFKADLEAHKGDPESITEVCADMSPAFISGFETQFPAAAMTFDKFHVIKLVNEAVDLVRRQEQKDRPELKKSRYIWLMNEENLKADQAQQLQSLTASKLNLKTARAYHLRLNFQEFYQQPLDQAEAYLKRWFFWATHSRLEPMVKVAYTIKRHWHGILRWFQSGINNGILEGINSLIQATKARARGYRSNRNFITMIYLIAGKLDIGVSI